ncbi:hypothetical protein WQE_19939 [Paraburkholderia hospita]|uniref:Uncharacterized protein n=1 Tax=Paraburkholderia hospita TaxID=169430 RepID=A0ABN0FKV6_9BURK|nr:hypothetical protein [Paraburkholderia hospita]EIM99262.1 hypothetical protein WQE_19939 [Paraburkholderia hospita]OUL86605.1 hypothetical protein CA602_15330 [Paraburkholderia hospita]
MSFFFTLLDDSLRPRGSRDPLGIEHLWSGIGRRLVGNLTTVTRHLDNFIVTLVGFHLCVDEKTGETNWKRFERFEQLTSRARERRNMPGVLGVRRIRNSANFPVQLGGGLQARILDNPRQAGLWGLYSTALTAAGLTNGMRRPTDEGAQIVRMFLESAPSDAWRIAVDTQRSQIDEAELTQVQAWVVDLLSNPAARRALADRLLSGSGARHLWHGEVFDQASAFMQDKKGKEDVPPARDFLHWLSEKSAPLQDFAARVLRFDEALVLSALTFDWLLGCHGRPSGEIEKEMATLANWPFTQPSVPDFADDIKDGEWRKRAQGLAAFCEAMARGAWREATERLLEHHAGVARRRGGAPWCYWEDDQMKVVMHTTPGRLPAADDITGEKFYGWMRSRSNDFFLKAFLEIMHQVDGVQQGASA